jgi:hypothetical protein
MRFLHALAGVNVPVLATVDLGVMTMTGEGNELREERQ